MKSTQCSLSHIQEHLLSPLSCASHKKYQFRSYEITSNLRPSNCNKSDYSRRVTSYFLFFYLQKKSLLFQQEAKEGKITPKENENKENKKNPELSTPIKMQNRYTMYCLSLHIYSRSKNCFK